MSDYSEVFGDDGDVPVRTITHRSIDEPRGEAARTVAAWVPVTRQAMVAAERMAEVLDDAVDRWLRPWRYPDPNPFPRFVPLPRLDRAHELLRRALRRARAVLEAVRER